MKKDVIEIIDSEIEYARSWDTLTRTERPLKDSEKPIEFWLLHIRRYLNLADEGCSGTDKTAALVNIRKIAALCAQCMEFNQTPKRINGEKGK
jgi:hypothetical protein